MHPGRGARKTIASRFSDVCEALPVLPRGAPRSPEFPQRQKPLTCVGVKLSGELFDDSSAPIAANRYGRRGNRAAHGLLTAAGYTFPTVLGRATAALEQAGKVTGKATTTGSARSPSSYAAPSPKSPSDSPGKSALPLE
jgi:hypothetical protein